MPSAWMVYGGVHERHSYTPFLSSVRSCFCPGLAFWGYSGRQVPSKRLSAQMAGLMAAMTLQKIRVLRFTTTSPVRISDSNVRGLGPPAPAVWECCGLGCRDS